MPGDLHNCRVCGFRFDEPPRGPGGDSPDYGFCPCCGVEVGYQDALPSAARAFRAAWLAAGARWDEPAQDDGLTTEERLTHVPPGFEDEA